MTPLSESRLPSRATAACSGTHLLTFRFNGICAVPWHDEIRTAMLDNIAEQHARFRRSSRGSSSAERRLFLLVAHCSVCHNHNETGAPTWSNRSKSMRVNTPFGHICNVYGLQLRIVACLHACMPAGPPAALLACRRTWLQGALCCSDT
mgnify:CR=1 FL=1